MGAPEAKTNNLEDMFNKMEITVVGKKGKN